MSARESIEMEIVRKVIGFQLAFNKELLEICQAKNNYLGSYACEETIKALKSVLNTLEKYKTTEPIDSQQVTA